MQKFNLIFIFLLSCIFAGEIDVLNLKNGDLIKGKIVENKINEYIKIELQGGSILTYSYDQIESIDIEQINQSTVQKSLIKSSPKVNCYQIGLGKGQSVSGGGAMIGGIGAGFLGGLIGTGIAYVVVASGNPQPNYYDIPDEESLECEQSFRNGYKESALRNKKTSVLIGGPFGTLIAVLFVASM